MESAEIVIADPRTGELLGELHALPAEQLADVLYAMQDRSSGLRKMQQAISSELRKRLDARGRRKATYGDYEVAIPQKSEWDWEELEGVLRDLVDHGKLTAGELTGVIHHEVTGSVREAQRIVDRLDGEARADVERCRKWAPSGSVRVTAVSNDPTGGNDGSD